MKNSLALTLLLAGATLVARPALAQLTLGGKTLPNGTVVTVLTMPEIPAVTHFFDNIKETPLPDNPKVEVHLLVSVSENQTVPNDALDKGHWFVAYAEVVPFLKDYAKSYGSLTPTQPDGYGATYLFSDRADPYSKPQPNRDPRLESGRQPFGMSRAEYGTMKFQYSPNRQGQVSNVNLLTGWKGWTIKTATQVSGTLLTGTLENGDVFTMSCRFSAPVVGR